MPTSKKPKAKRAASKSAQKTGETPVQKASFYQELNAPAGLRRGRPMKTGKKAKNKSA